MQKLKAMFCPMFFLLLVACSDDPNNKVENEVIDAVSNGTWRITYFYDSDVDKTSTYQEYIFTFGSGNLLTAKKTSTIQSGLWNISDTNDNVDTLDDLRFNITYNTPVEFELLMNDWKITEYSLTKIKLTDVNDTGGDDYLTFEKN
ncbi:MAG: hypothetical protein ABI663_21630 [Chryseolinea sp.]